MVRERMIPHYPPDTAAVRWLPSGYIELTALHAGTTVIQKWITPDVAREMSVKLATPTDHTAGRVTTRWLPQGHVEVFIHYGPGSFEHLWFPADVARDLVGQLVTLLSPDRAASTPAQQ